MESRFARTELVLGRQNLLNLAKVKVAVVGLGGVGGYVAESLARSGVGALTLIDHDLVSITNLNRQIIALDSTLGRAKVEVMAERIREINPECEVDARQAFYEKDRHSHLIPTDVDFIADAIDTVVSKVDLVELALRGNTPIISSLGTGNKLDLTLLTITDISKTHTCPLARAVRGVLRKRGITQGVDVVFSPEKPRSNNQDRIPGSTAFVPPAAGLLMASWIVGQVCQEV